MNTKTFKRCNSNYNIGNHKVLIKKAILAGNNTRAKSALGQPDHEINRLPTKTENKMIIAKKIDQTRNTKIKYFTTKKAV